MGDMQTTVGIDGCAAGWIIASVDRVVVVPKLRLGEFELVGIDMPIGLVDGPPRACDIAARKFLGRAGSSVFPAPPRAALAHSDYRAALAVARSATGRGISKQTFNLMPKIAELDQLINPTNQHMIVEVHPECTFKMLNEGEGLPSKKIAAGQDLRRHLLADQFDIPAKPPRGAAVDDLLDAYAVLWSAQRYRRGVHQLFGDGQCDERGIEMRIVC
jgi:predicted RNase H-like nuclease